MKKLVIFLFGILLATPAFAAVDSASALRSYGYDGNAYIFIEGPVEFSVFPDGQFDFVYLGYDNRGRVNVNINTGNVNINYNSGYNYDPYIQYDDYGAVIQIENIPIYYDQFGRIIRAGNTNIVYNDRRIVRVGGLRIFYNHWGGFDYCTGFINLWTPRYIWRPWHTFYMRPFYAHCIVYDIPYRRYYNPFRYPYWRHRELFNNRGRVSYANGRRDFYRPGSRLHYRNGRTQANPNYDSNRRNPVAANNPVRDRGRHSVSTNRSAANDGIANERTRPKATQRSGNSAKRQARVTQRVSRERPPSRIESPVKRNRASVQDRIPGRSSVSRASRTPSVDRGYRKPSRVSRASRSAATPRVSGRATSGTNRSSARPANRTRTKAGAVNTGRNSRRGL